jgi:FkbM family methyltransferase
MPENWTELPSSVRLPDGKPRFSIIFPSFLSDDLGAQALLKAEAAQGYELPTRNLLEKILRPGDLFVDVGAHWGYFTLQATTHPAGDILAVAIEPDPENGGILYTNLVHNQVANTAILVCAACGGELELAPLVTNSSMGHSIRGAALNNARKGTPKFVVVMSLDALLGCFPQLATRRMILKIDAEGYEAKVMAGAQRLLDSGRVALIIWELGNAFKDGSERGAILAMVESLSRRGYRHFRTPGLFQEGALVPFNPDDPYVICNIFSFAPGTTPPDQGDSPASH